MRRESAVAAVAVIGLVLAVAGTFGSTFASAAEGVDPAGGWRYQKGGFGDDLTLTADGRAASALDPSNGGRWQMEGDVLVIRWQNGWTNRYRIGPGAGPFSGADIDPQGTSHDGGSLSRLGSSTQPQDGVDVTRRSLGDGLSEYIVYNHDHGTHELPMPGHRYCALTLVASGGFNSRCHIRKEGGGWVLVTIDPPPPDGPFIGQSQNCAATCFD